MRGNITRRGKNSWRLKFEAGEPDPLTAKRQTRFVTVRGTRKDAETALTRYLGEIDKGAFVEPTKETLGTFLDRWTRDWAESHVSGKTLERYKELIDHHVKPTLSDVRLQKLWPDVFVGLYGTLKRPKADGGGGLSPRTIGHVHRVLRQALGYAVKWGCAASNPLAGEKPPKVEKTEIEILTEEQTKAVLAGLRGRTLYPIVMLALATGMRRGELLALRWCDVDLDGGRISVNQSLEQTKAGLRFKPPKTERGRRTITLPASVVTELRAHRKEQLERRVALGLGKLPDDALVFPNLDGEPRKPNSLTTEWLRLIGTLKLPRVSFHALRHTHASNLIAAGMDILTISRRLGHSEASITLNVYGHLTPNADERAAQVTETALASLLRDANT